MSCVALRDVPDATLNGFTKRLRPRSANVVVPEYARYCFRAPSFRQAVTAMSSLSTRASLNNEMLSRLSILLPPPEQQAAIGRILGTLDDKIELNRRMCETLEAMARALFESWFVNFDPARAKAEGRDPGLPKPLANLFPTRLVDSELGEIPEGWSVDSIYAIADVIYGAPFSSSHFNTEQLGMPLIRIRDLTNESPVVWTPKVHPKGYKVKPGDIVVGMDGEFRAYLWGGDEAWLNQRVCVFAPKAAYSAAFVRNSIFEPLAHIETTETATTVIHLGKIHLGKSDIDRFSLVVPSAGVLGAFNQCCQLWYDRIVAAKRESRTLAALRDTLLPKLISGELRVAAAEKILENTQYDRSGQPPTYRKSPGAQLPCAQRCLARADDTADGAAWTER
ncbi:MAG: restriction endonuclease subunit S [Gammaproteobacteria bacterium]